MRFVKAARETKFRDGARLRWIGDEQVAVIVRLQGRWRYAICEEDTSLCEGAYSIHDDIVRPEFDSGMWEEV